MPTAGGFTLYFRRIGYKSLQKIQVYTDVYAVHEITSVGGGRGGRGLMECCTRRTLKAKE